MNHHQHNKRLAKNTLLLYFRTLLVMVVSLYTSRVVLRTLGVEDYGIYNVVGGAVAMFSILSGSLSSAINRFMTFELGKQDSVQLKKVFSTALTIQVILSVIIVILAETAGLWFLETQMVIPMERMPAARWVFHSSIAVFVINLISVPYNAAIVAHEKMSAFAYISILEVSLKLLVVYLLAFSPVDTLTFYALLLVLVALIIRFVYALYCKRHFAECKYQLVRDPFLLKQMFSFSGWNFIGSSSAVLRSQGINILLNLFFGPVVNAARGIATQVNAALNGFINNFTTALKPQIIKNYAAGNYSRMVNLIEKGSRLSFYMFLLFSLPVLIETEIVLRLWLTIVPEHTVNFIRLILILTMTEVLSTTLVTAAQATGKIRDYQLVVGGIQLFNLPVSYVLLKVGFFPEITTMAAIALSCCCLFARLYMLRKMIRLSLGSYFKKVLLNAFLVLTAALMVPLYFHFSLPYGVMRAVVVVTCSLVCTSLSIYFIGCDHSERKMVNDKIKKRMAKFRK